MNFLQNSHNAISVKNKGYSKSRRLPIEYEIISGF